MRTVSLVYFKNTFDRLKKLYIMGREITDSKESNNGGCMKKNVALIVLSGLVVSSVSFAQTGLTVIKSTKTGLQALETGKPANNKTFVKPETGVIVETQVKSASGANYRVSTTTGNANVRTTDGGKFKVAAPKTTTTSTSSGLATGFSKPSTTLVKTQEAAPAASADPKISPAAKKASLELNAEETAFVDSIPAAEGKETVRSILQTAKRVDVKTNGAVKLLKEGPGCLKEMSVTGKSNILVHFDTIETSLPAETTNISGECLVFNAAVTTVETAIPTAYKFSREVAPTIANQLGGTCNIGLPAHAAYNADGSQKPAPAGCKRI